MNTQQKEIIEMARQVGVDMSLGEHWSFFIEELEAFYKLVADKEQEKFSADLIEYGKAMAAVEREACAKVCDEISFRASDRHDAMTDDRNDEPILYMTGKESGSKSCADAIRARGEA